MRLRTIRKVKEEERREEVGWVACKTRGEGKRGGEEGEEGRGMFCLMFYVFCLVESSRNLSEKK